MNAFLYNGLIEHHRHKPKDHQFRYPLYVYGFDLGDLPEMDRRLPFFGYNRFRPASVHDKDYLDSGPGTIRHRFTTRITSTADPGRSARSSTAFSRKRASVTLSRGPSSSPRRATSTMSSTP